MRVADGDAGRQVDVPASAVLDDKIALVVLVEVPSHLAGETTIRNTFNLFPVSRVQCPILVLGGEEDPMTPIECQMDLAAALPAHLVRFERFPGCGHGVVPDAPERAMAVIRDFIVH